MAKQSTWKIGEEIESRQDEVLRMLDELNGRLERALADLGVAVSEPTIPIVEAAKPSAVEPLRRAA